MRRTLVAAVALLLALLSLTACSDGSSGSAGSGGGTSIDITIKNGKVTPNGDRVKAKVGQPITLHIDADTAGEIHVHSTPEQHIDFDKGTSTKKLTITSPGIVDVEDHALDQVIVQLEVS
jgi:hypothetical protein